MATTLRRENTPVTEQLAREPYRFGFLQAVRILGAIDRQQSKAKQSPRRRPTGEDYNPREEIVRFRALPAHRFPAGPIRSLRQSENAADEGSTTIPPELIVSFLGMTGPSGVLPQHYTQLVIERVRQRDYALRDFLDMFNHRAVSFFYRAMEKYRFPLAFEQAAWDQDRIDDDLFTRCLYSLVGWGTPGLRGRLALRDDTLLYYAGHFAHYPRNAVSLEMMTSDFFELPVTVEQFCGQWLYLRQQDQTRIASGKDRAPGNNQLGVTAVVGERVWGIENKFRLRVGPLSYDEFLRFMPDGDQLVRLCQLVRCFVGPDFDFDVKLALKAEEVPLCRTAGNNQAARLGWSSWAHSRRFERDVEDAVFEHEAAPCV